MSFTEEVIQRTKHIEKLLSDLGGTGRGLRERADSIRHLLSDLLLDRLSFIATIRNKIVHDIIFTFQGDEQSFLSSCDTAISQLSALATLQDQQPEVPIRNMETSQEPTTTVGLEVDPNIPGETVPTTKANSDPSVVFIGIEQPKQPLNYGYAASVACAAILLISLPFTCTRFVHHGIWPFDSYEEVTDWSQVYSWGIFWTASILLTGYVVFRRR